MKYKNGLLEARVEVPQEEFPQYNFMGLILGKVVPYHHVKHILNMIIFEENLCV